MPKFSNKKALSDSQKRERFLKIIISAKELLETKEYKKITISEIAALSGLAKGTLFLYFNSKEDIFLTLAKELIDSWSENLVKSFDTYIKSDKSISVDTFTTLVLTSLNNSNLLKLLSIIDDTLEQNIDKERAIKFKLFLKERLQNIGSKIEKVFPKLDSGDGITIINSINVSLIGSYKVTNTSTVINEIVKKPGMEIFNREFESIFYGLIKYYIEGFLQSK